MTTPNAKHLCPGCGKRRVIESVVKLPSLMHPGLSYTSTDRFCEACGRNSTVGTASGGEEIERVIDDAKGRVL